MLQLQSLQEHLEQPSTFVQLTDMMVKTDWWQEYETLFVGDQITRIMFPSLNLGTPFALLHAENERIQRWLICPKPSSPCSLYTSFWRPENAQRLTVTAKSLRTLLPSKSLTSSGIEPGREERGAAGCATERKNREAAQVKHGEEFWKANWALTPPGDCGKMKCS